ncbi:MAG: hypothetical protein K2N05_08580 [Muribaculaceae bacterium]|nr:hypothetical protein [Muribaculaceae bacterium]
MKKLKKSIYIPIIVFIYFCILLYNFVPDIIRSGQYWRIYTIAGGELTIIILLYFSLRKKEKMANDNKKTKG